MSNIYTYFISNINSILRLAKFLVFLIESLTKNIFNVKNIFECSKKICEQNSEYFMVNLDLESLFTNISLKKTIVICCDSLYKDQGQRIFT